jgi:hypothetical protein
MASIRLSLRNGPLELHRASRRSCEGKKKKMVVWFIEFRNGDHKWQLWNLKCSCFVSRKEKKRKCSGKRVSLLDKGSFINFEELYHVIQRTFFKNLQLLFFSDFPVSFLICNSNSFGENSSRYRSSWLLHVGLMQGYSQSISLTPWPPPTYQFATASAIVWEINTKT